LGNVVIGNPEYRTSVYDEVKGKYFEDLSLFVAFFGRKDIVLSFVLTQKERTKEKVKTEEKYG
jgi:hypothetical protein